MGLAPRPRPAASTPAPDLPSAPPDDADVNKLPMGSLSLSSSKQSRPKLFRFLDLPSELRIKIYELHFADTPNPVDLDPDNHKRLYRKLAIFKTCRQVYAESSHYYYSTRPFRIFPTHPGRFFKTKKPLLARLTPSKRGCLTSLELRLGPGWNKPPKGWVVNPALGLQDCVNVRRVTVFVECDPSDGIFKGFRQSDGFYEGFCRKLLADVLEQLPQAHAVFFDAWPSVKKSGGMMRGLLDVTTSHGRMVRWGPERGWTDAPEEEKGSKRLTIALPPPTLDEKSYGGPFSPQQSVLVMA